MNKYLERLYNGIIKENPTFVQKKQRPAIIISSDISNQHASVLTVIPLSTCKKKYIATHAKIRSTKKQSVALVEQITVVDKKSVQEYIAEATIGEIHRINKILIRHLCLWQETKKERCYEVKEKPLI